MGRYLLLLALFLPLLLCVSCSDDDDDNNITSPTTVIGSGNLTTETHSLPPFSSVSMITVGDIMVATGAQQAVSVTVDDNIHQHLRLTVTGGELLVTSADGVDLEDFDLTVEVTMTEAQRLSLIGVGSIIGQNTISGDELNLSLTGVGNINLDVDVTRLNSTHTSVGTFMLSGTARSHVISHTGVGQLLAFYLVTDTTTISMTGAGTAEVYADSVLNVTITGTGSVYYQGYPEINSTITGVGQLINAN